MAAPRAQAAPIASGVEAARDCRFGTISRPISALPFRSATGRRVNPARNARFPFTLSSALKLCPERAAAHCPNRGHSASKCPGRLISAPVVTGLHKFNPVPRSQSLDL